MIVRADRTRQGRGIRTRGVQVPGPEPACTAPAVSRVTRGSAAPTARSSVFDARRSPPAASRAVDVDRDAGRAVRHAGGKRELPALQALVHDREAPARPHDQLDLRLAPVEEHEDVPAQRVVSQHMADLVCQTVERLAQIRRLRREIDPDRAGQQDHVGLSSSRISSATHAGDASPRSIKTPFGSRTTTPNLPLDPTSPVTRAGTSEINAVERLSPPSRFRHQ